MLSSIKMERWEFTLCNLQRANLSKEWDCVKVSVCVCVWVRESVCVFVWDREYVCLSERERVCVYLCECESVCVCVCVRERKECSFFGWKKDTLFLYRDRCEANLSSQVWNSLRDCYDPWLSLSFPFSAIYRIFLPPKSGKRNSVHIFFILSKWINLFPTLVSLCP